MAESVYKVIALVGTSSESWEKATAAAVERASQTLRDLRVARVVELFVLNPGQRFHLSQIVEELNPPISTVHSILTTLVGRRWLVRRAADKAYALGPRLASAGSASRAATVGLREVEAAVDRKSVEPPFDIIVRSIDGRRAATASGSSSMSISRCAQSRPTVVPASWTSNEPRIRVHVAVSQLGGPGAAPAVPARLAECQRRRAGVALPGPVRSRSQRAPSRP